MMPRSCRRAGVGFVAILAAGCSLDAQIFHAEGSFDRILPVNGPVDLSVRTGSGNIQVQTSTDNQVRVVGHIRALGSVWNGLSGTEQVKRLQGNPPIDQTGDTIQIGDIKDIVLRQNVSISYRLTVPADTRLRAHSGSGDQSIGAIRGPLEASAGSGDIRIDHINEHVSASTGSGHIELFGADAGLEVSAGSGSIRAEAVTGPIKARTGSGNVRLAQTAPGAVDVSTGSGAITLTGTQGPLRLRAGSGDIVIEGQLLRDWALSTGSGDVTIRVPADASFNLDARTASGLIDTKHPIELLGTLSRRRLQGKVRGGGTLLDVSTGSGAIRIN